MIQVTQQAVDEMKSAIPELLNITAEEGDYGLNTLTLYFDGYDIDAYAAKAIEKLKSYGLDVDRWMPMGKTGDFAGKYKFRIAVLINTPIPEPPTPRTIMPPRMKVPDKVSDKALELLRLIESGADVRIRWWHKIPSMTVNDVSRSDLEAVYHSELTEVGTAYVYTGFGQPMTMDVGQHILTHHEQTESDYDAGIEEKITLSDEGRKFLEAVDNA